LLANYQTACELVQSKQLSSEEITKAVEENRKRAEELRQSLQPTPASKWRKYLFNAVILGLIIYVTQFSSSPQPQQAAGRPQYWHN